MQTQKYSLRPYHKSSHIEAGCDEAGRGALSGPVFAAAVILPNDFKNDILNDSKQLTAKQRNELRPIIEFHALAWAVAFVDVREIESINILNSSIKAMHLALDKLKVAPDFILVDGNKFKPYKLIPHKCFIGGDAKYMSIAAASVLAKTYRDDFMVTLSKEFSNYGWEHNMGYATKQHRDAIVKFGITPYHRKTYLGNILQMSFDF